MLPENKDGDNSNNMRENYSDEEQATAEASARTSWNFAAFFSPLYPSWWSGRSPQPNSQKITREQLLLSEANKNLVEALKERKEKVDEATEQQIQLDAQWEANHREQQQTMRQLGIDTQQESNIPASSSTSASDAQLHREPGFDNRAQAKLPMLSEIDASTLQAASSADEINTLAKEIREETQRFETDVAAFLGGQFKTANSCSLKQ